MVAKHYTRVIRNMGVELSDSKTHVSKTHYEFAKRWFRSDGEISPIPISGISDNISDVGVILQIFYNLCIDRRDRKSVV